MIGPILLILCGVLVLGSLAMLGLTLMRIAGLADKRAPHPTPPAGIRHQQRILADRWYREGRLTTAGYARLITLADDMGRDAFVYWSGGEQCGTACVWDGSQRYTAEEWNHQASGIQTWEREQAIYGPGGEYSGPYYVCATCAPADAAHFGVFVAHGYTPSTPPACPLCHDSAAVSPAPLPSEDRYPVKRTADPPLTL